ncbi:MAG: ROK family protein [Pirellulaceae bacterium]
MYLGIEIGGTKLQLGVSDGQQAELRKLARAEIEPELGAAGILQQIRELGRPLVASYGVTRIGIGFGGPVEAEQGRVIKSHQIAGWENFPLVNWCQETLGVSTILGNDCDVATLAEANLGAGQGRRSVFFVTVGTGVGGGFVQDGRLLGAGRPAASEIGHLRPGLQAIQADQTVESLASGWGIAAAAHARLNGEVTDALASLSEGDRAENRVQRHRRLVNVKNADAESIDDLLMRCDHNLDHLTARTVAAAAEEGNVVAQRILGHALEVLGWAIAQTITLLAPEVVVVGGGVSLIGQRNFFVPLRREVARYVFPALRDSYTIEPAALGESVVVQGALWLAAHHAEASGAQS